MDPRDASVYTDTWSPLTWVIILTVVIVAVMTLMVAFIALVHRSIEHSADTPRPQADTGSDQAEVTAAMLQAGLPAGSPHAA